MTKRKSGAVKGGWTREMRQKAAQKLHTRKFATRQEDEDAICLLRVQLLKGRTAALVDDVHRTALLTLPPSAVSGWKVTDPKYVGRLLDYLEANVYADQEEGRSTTRSCWGRTAEVSSFPAKKGGAE